MFCMYSTWIGETLRRMEKLRSSGSWVSERSAGTSGTLTVTDGTHTARLTMLGQYQLANFTLTDDGYSVALDAEVPAGSQDAVRAAADSCPEHAITVS